MLRLLCIINEIMTFPTPSRYRLFWHRTENFSSSYQDQILWVSAYHHEMQNIWKNFRLDTPPPPPTHTNKPNAYTKKLCISQNGITIYPKSCDSKSWKTHNKIIQNLSIQAIITGTLQLESLFYTNLLAEKLVRTLFISYHSISLVRRHKPNWIYVTSYCWTDMNTINRIINRTICKKV